MTAEWASERSRGRKRMRGSLRGSGCGNSDGISWILKKADRGIVRAGFLNAVKHRIARKKLLLVEHKMQIL